MEKKDTCQPIIFKSFFIEQPDCINFKEKMSQTKMKKKDDEHEHRDKYLYFTNLRF